jgi:lysophospholipase L1-like esterase
MKGILCFGDSITFGIGEKGGWVGRLKEYFEPRGGHNGVYNLGICGDTTEGLLERFKIEANSRIEYIWPNERYLITIAIGINDSRGMGSPDKIIIKPNKFKQNIEKIHKQALKFTKDIVFIGLTPVNEKLVHPFEGTYFSNEIIQKYNNIIKEYCRKNKIRFIEIYDKMSKLDYTKLLEDGLHPNSKGFDVMFKIIKEELRWFLK